MNSAFVADRFELPDGLVLVRVTSEFDRMSTPAGLRRAHRIAPGVWGVLRVRSGSLRFVVDGGGARTLTDGECQVIPPEVEHHVELIDEVRFVVEFHRATDTVPS